MKMKTEYLGLELEHPIIAGASPMVNFLDTVRRLEDAGAAAITMHSLFEEQINHFNSGVEEHILSHMDAFAEATSYFPRTLDFALGPERYLQHLEKVKNAVSVPVIASLNGVNLGAWVEYADLIEKAGADAIELNLYYLPTDPEANALDIEKRSTEVVAEVNKMTSLPLAVKLSPFFSSLPNFAKNLVDAGADALVLFNRYYQPDIDIENLEMNPALKLSDSNEIHLRLRWLAILSGSIKCDLALTGGVHSPVDAIKGIMAGANCVQMVSALLKNGPEYLRFMIEGVSSWMEEHEYETMSQMTGSMSYSNTPNPESVERANYMKILQSWNP